MTSVDERPPLGAAAPGTVWARVATAGDGPMSPRAALRAFAIFAALLGLAISWRGLGGVVFILAMAAMIMLHEAGHFIAAKASGMKVTQFFLGFGPRLWSFRRGETEYGVKALPLGGFVRIVGMHNLEEVAPEDEARTYRAATFPRRLVTICAGSFVHLLLALILLTVVWSGFGELVPPAVIAKVSPTIDGVSSAAHDAGLRPGDRIVAIGGVPTPDWYALSYRIAATAGKPTRFDVIRSSRAMAFLVTPKPRQCGGFRVGIESVKPRPVRRGPSLAFREVGDDVSQTYAGLAGFFAPSHLRRYRHTLSNAGSPQPSPGPCNLVEDPYRFISPKGAVDIGAASFKQGARPFLRLLAGLNVSIGLLNMLPLLPLDGGHAVIAIYERVRSRRRRYRANIMKLVPLTWAVLAVLLTVGVSSLYLDIRQPIQLDEPPVVTTVSKGVRK